MIGDSKYHNKNIGKICLYLILRFIFIKLKVKNIKLNVVKNNLPALKLYRKFLMREKKRGKFIYFSMTRQFFNKKINKNLTKLVIHKTK